ncbi:hypothetical protein LCGC14_2819860 [marine sediment metagenome]|uniref:SMODS and SLOG-associating 2TM effector domain-containing protein n=1 Tax=marine sediment metagenome TaxID=412755 RepID=A0A0F8Z449_9ZZZZ
MSANFWAERAAAAEKARVLEKMVRDEERGVHVFEVAGLGVAVGAGLSLLAAGWWGAATCQAICGAAFTVAGTFAGWTRHAWSRDFTRRMRKYADDFWHDDALMVAQMMELEEMRNHLDGSDT